MQCCALQVIDLEIMLDRFFSDNPCTVKRQREVTRRCERSQAAQCGQWGQAKEPANCYFHVVAAPPHFPLQLASSAGAEADVQEQEVAGLNFYKLAYVPGILPA